MTSYQHARSISHDSRLKPFVLADTASVNSTWSTDSYKPLATATVTDVEISQLEARDAKLKSRIRLLRIISRVLATILSAATLAPLVLTVVKFLQTRNVYYNVNGQERTAWADGTITTYTFVYLGVTSVSFLFNAAILISYCRGVAAANKTSKFAGYWSAFIMVAHVVIWIIAVSAYRYGKQAVDGKFRDLWGWTCSKAAADIQDKITDINFSQYCTIQSVSFYTGIVNTLAGITSAVIYLLVVLRMRSKKNLRRASSRVSEAMEPLRY